MHQIKLFFLIPIEIFNELLKPVMNEGDILAMIARASEFEQLKVRDDEMDELDDLTHEWCQVSLDQTWA